MKRTEDPAVKSFLPDFGLKGSLRQPFGHRGRVHIDRWLPFIILHRGDEERTSVARRIAIESPSYFVWSPDDDAAALNAIEAVIPAIASKANRLFVVVLDDRSAKFEKEGSQALPEFAAQLGAGDKGDVGRAADALESALRSIAIDLRHCKVERVPFEPLLPAQFNKALNRIVEMERLSLRVPQIHRRPDGGEFPAIAHELSTGFGDAILRAACAFVDDGKTKAPTHYRALGRSAYLAVAFKADRKLDRVARSYDFLLSVSPIDTDKAFDRFIAEGEGKSPRFHYRPLTIDPDDAKRKLYSINLRALEDPLLEQLLAEKRHELDAQLTMLATRNTPAFQSASIFLYGAISADVLKDAVAILPADGKSQPRGRSVGAREIAVSAEALAATYRTIDPAFAPDIQIRDDVAGLMVSGKKLFVGTNTMVPENRLQALLAHEVSVHLLTHFNGANQRLAIFRTGLAGYEGIQEGLGVFAEWATGGLTRSRLRLLAARVVAVAAMERGASFIEVYRNLTREHGFSKRGAFGIAARVFRSGGFAKDAIYLQGFRAVTSLVAAGAPLNPFWLGKIALAHVPAIEELLQRELVQPPLFKPSFLADEAAAKRIASVGKAKSFPEIVAGA